MSTRFHDEKTWSIKNDVSISFLKTGVRVCKEDFTIKDRIGSVSRLICGFQPAGDVLTHGNL